MTGSPVSVLDLLSNYYVTREKLSELVALERAEREKDAVIRKLSDHIEGARAELKLPILQIFDEISGRISGSCWSSSGLQPDQILRNRCLAKFGDIVSAIQALTPNEFEQFCAAFLSSLGATKTKVTVQSGDDGIDFYGWLHLGEHQPSQGVLANKVRLYFAGQAKHYPKNRLGTAVVRELVGAVELGKAGTISNGQNLFDNERLRPFDPLVVLLITTGAFTKGARKLAAGCGIFTFDVGHVAYHLADRHIGFVLSEESVSFSKEEFDNWITVHANFQAV